jgi:hypothetical protein
VEVAHPRPLRLVRQPQPRLALPLLPVILASSPLPSLLHFHRSAAAAVFSSRFIWGLGFWGHGTVSRVLPCACAACGGCGSRSVAWPVPGLVWRAGRELWG